MSDATVPLVRDTVTVTEPFEVLYQREFRPMVRLAAALVDTPEQAVAYLRVCVLNGGRRVLRRRRLARRQPDLVEVYGELGFNHVLDAVRRLPARQRNVIVLRYEHQLSDPEIAETLGMPLGTVKSTMHRALARLRTEVSE
jgi:RNA polymerase sigma factor (sigma-70 family)